MLDQEYYRCLYKPAAGGRWVLVTYAAVTKRNPGGDGPGGGLDGMQRAQEEQGLPLLREATYPTRDKILGELQD